MKAAAIMAAIATAKTIATTIIFFGDGFLSADSPLVFEVGILGVVAAGAGFLGIMHSFNGCPHRPLFPIQTNQIKHKKLERF